MTNQQAKQIYIAGHNGMVGRALVRRLSQDADINIIVKNKAELDLTNQQAVQAFFAGHKIDEVYIAAAKVGGIQANNVFPAEFIYQNLMIQSNIIQAAHAQNVQKLLFLGSSCIYPKLTSQPIHETALMTGLLEPTNESYAIAKIAGIKLCESYNRQYGRDYRSVMPTNLYGLHDNFHPENSHVIPALIYKFYQAIVKQDLSVNVWGSGQARREFLFVDDMADACVHVMNCEQDSLFQQVSPMCSHINLGTGQDCSIKQLAELLAKVTGFKGKLIFDLDKPEGTPVKRLDIQRLNNLVSWRSSTSLEEGLAKTWAWYLAEQAS
jgi:GDP-L-fucose synthase